MQRIWQIIKLGLWLGTTVFGGVAVAYPLIRERAGQLGEVSSEEVDGLYALSVFLPGPSFLNLWGAVCARAAGLPGAILGQAALMLPAAALVLLLPLLTRIQWVADHAAGAFNGVIWATAGLMVASAVKEAARLKSPGQWAIAALVLLGLLMGVHPLILLVLAIGWGAFAGIRRAARREVAP